jgi:DNA-binding PadR family transcriptional regulator
MDVGSILLGFLMYRSMTGYELRKFFSISFSFFSGLSYGSIYPALGKMEKAGLITMRLEVRDGSPNRKVYTITGAGRKAFLAALRTPLPVERHKNAFLVRLFFFAHLSRQERLEVATGYLNSIREAQKDLESARPRIEATPIVISLCVFNSAWTRAGIWCATYRRSSGLSRTRKRDRNPDLTVLRPSQKARTHGKRAQGRTDLSDGSFYRSSCRENPVLPRIDRLS